MTREFDFLLAAVRRFFQPDSALPSAAGLDWIEISRLANYHAVTPFLNHTSEDRDFSDKARAAARFNLTLSAELVKLARLFEKHMIEMITLKGPVLGVALYEDKALKDSLDLDLLVHARDALRAKSALEKIGYRLESVPHWPIDSAFLRNPNSQLSFSDPAGQVSLDLHWRLLPGYFPRAFDDSELWTQPCWSPWGNTRVRTLAPEHLFLFLCAHGAKHLWRRLGWICDAARLLQVESELDWSEISTVAARTGTSRMVSLGLLLASDLLGVKLPPGAAGLAVYDARTHALGRTVINRLRTARFASAVETAMFGIRAFERNSQRARLLFGIFCQPTEAEYLDLRLPPSLYWTYYLFRPLRLAVKYSRSRG